MADFYRDFFLADILKFINKFIFLQKFLNYESLVRKRRAPFPVDRVHRVDQKLHKLAHIFLVPDHNINVPVPHLQGQAFPGVPWHILRVFEVLDIHCYHVLSEKPETS